MWRAPEHASIERVQAIRALRGATGSPGHVAGPVFVAREHAAEAGSGLSGNPEAEFQAAAERAADRLRRAAATAPAALKAVLEAQALMVLDPGLRSAAVAAAAREPLATAVTSAAAGYAARLEALPDPYLRERAADAREAGRLIVAALTGTSFTRLAELRSPAVVFAHELSPADTLSAEPELVLAIVTEIGGRTSHAAIVARELGIPAVIGVKEAVAEAAGEHWAEVDADAGVVTFLDAAPPAQQRAHVKAVRADGLGVELMANVSSAAAARAASDAGARGIGLFRTEMLFAGRDRPMDEDEQVAVYAAACEAMAPHPVVIRALDIGSDKPLPYLAMPVQPNPALGFRGVRLWLREEQLWRPQARALARVAADHPNLEVMFPMVGAPEELAEARERLASMAAGGRLPRIGMMVELPAAVAGIEAFRGIADFISIGTNDLTQYALGIDRELEWPPYLSEFSPGVLRLIAGAIRSATEIGIDSAVCGEFAGSVEGAVFLAGAGVSALSMAAESLARVSQALSRLGADDRRAATESALKAGTAGAARAVLAGSAGG